MSVTYGVPVVAVDLVINSAVCHMKVGAAIDSMIIKANPENEVITGTLAGIQLGVKKSANRFCTIFDGVPTCQYATDDKANIRDAGSYYAVDYILVNKGTEEEPEMIKVAVADIVSISGTFENPDGSKTVAVEIPVDQEEGATPVTDAIAAVASEEKPATISLPAAEVKENLTVNAGVNIKGVNAGVAQNHAQEV